MILRRWVQMGTKSRMMSKDVLKKRPFFMQFLRKMLSEYFIVLYNGNILAMFE